MAVLTGVGCQLIVEQRANFLGREVLRRGGALLFQLFHDVGVAVIVALTERTASSVGPPAARSVEQSLVKSSVTAIGQEVIKSLKPDQLMIKIVHDELVNLMGPVDTRIYTVTPGPTLIMMCGLQGSGKTTTCGKLALPTRGNMLDSGHKCIKLVSRPCWFI